MISGLKERVGGYEEWVRDLTIGLSTTVKSRKICKPSIQSCQPLSATCNLIKFIILISARTTTRVR